MTPNNEFERTKLQFHPVMRHSKFLAGLSLCIGLFGCASTKVETSGAAPKWPLCQADGEQLSALALWGPAWRTDQKDVPHREAAAQRGIEHFFDQSGCFSKVEIRRLPGDRSAFAPADLEILELARANKPTPDRLVVITVRELGPVVRLFGSPALVEGGTEVVLELKVLNVRTGESMANLHTHWQNGGALVIKGVKTLEQDMSAALQAALAPAAHVKR
jgi:hypothetical protein